MRLIRRGGYYTSGIRIDKPSPGGVIIPAAEVVQARLGVIDIPTIAQGICSAEGGGHGAVGGQGRTPGVIGVGHHLGAAGIDKTGNVALGVLQVEILNAVIRHGRRPQAVVGEVHPIAAPGQVRQGVAQVRVVVRCAVDRLGNALAVGIVAVGDAAAALAHGRQLAAMLPAVGPCAVGQGIAYGVVGNGFPVICRQQVRPIGVAVGVGAACCPDVADKRRARPSAGILIPPRRVPDPPDREIFPPAAGFQIACVPRPAVVETPEYEAIEEACAPDQFSPPPLSGSVWYYKPLKTAGLPMEDHLCP